MELESGFIKVAVHAPQVDGQDGSRTPGLNVIACLEGKG